MSNCCSPHSNCYHYVKNHRFDLVENYEQANKEQFKDWILHHRNETHEFIDGKWVLRPFDRGLSVKELKERDLYKHRPPEELVWMKRKEHSSLHHMFNTTPSRKEAFKNGGNLISKANKGRHRYKVTQEMIDDIGLGPTKWSEKYHKASVTYQKLKKEIHNGVLDVDKIANVSPQSIHWNKGKYRIQITQEMIDDISLGPTKWCEKYHHNVCTYYRIKKETSATKI